MTRLLPVWLLTSALMFAPSPATGDEPANKAPYREQLKLLTIPASELPAGCTLIAEIRTASIIGAKENPCVSQQPEFVEGLARLGFALGDGNKKTPAGIDAEIVIMYQDQQPANEIGVYALVCKDEAAAVRLLKEIPQPLHAEIARKDSLLIRVWKDDGASKMAYNAVRDYLRKQGFK